jgi:guanylate kinase
MSLTLRAWKGPDRGALFVVTGPSGCGKSTLLHEAFRVIPGLEFSVSATTRGAREGETDGVDYHFVDDARFEQLLDEEALLEWAQVYDRRYGTPRAPVLEALDSGRSVVLDIDLLGARQVRQAYPEAVLIFVLPPDLDALEQRLRARDTDSEEVIRRRMDLVAEQLAGVGEFDYLVVNDDLATAHDSFQAVILAELSRADRRPSLVQRMQRAP